MAIDYFKTSGVMSTSYDGIDYHPVLKLNYLNSDKVGPRTTFLRSTAATYFNSLGRYTLASSNSPRFDYDPVTLQKRGLQLEEDGTNLVSYSNNPNTGWIPSSGPPTLTPLSQDGIFTPTRVGSIGVNWHRLQNGPIPLTAGTKYSVTILFKPGTSGQIWTELRFDTSNTFVVSGSVAAPTIGNNQGFTVNTQPLVKIHKSGIYELTYTVTPSTSTEYYIGVGPNSTVSGEYIDLYGAQIESDSAPTSFIVTTNNTSTVNRSRDNCYISGTEFSSILSTSEATLVVDHVMSSSSSAGFVAALYGSGVNYTGLAYSGGSGAFLGNTYYVSGTQFNSGLPDTATYAGYDKIASSAVAYDSTGVITYYSGNRLEHSGTFEGAISPTQLTLGARSQNGDFDANVWIRRVALYDRRLPEKDLIYLTSFEL